MITKKQLKKELTETRREFKQFVMETQIKVKELEESIVSLTDLYAANFDTLTNKEASNIVGKGYLLRAKFYRENGITFTTRENGELSISRKSLENYINNLNK